MSDRSDREVDLVVDPPFFDDPERERSFRAEGYTTQRVLPADVAADLERRISEIYPPGRTGMTYTNVDEDRELWHAADPIVRPALERHLTPLFPRHRLAFTVVVVKHPGEGSAMSAHEDGTFVDPRDGRTAAVWIPLVDCAAEDRNGGIAVLPRSHRMVSTCAGANVPEWFAPYRAHLSERLVPVPVRAGEGVMWDTRLLHGSPPNESERSRIVVVAVLSPKGADLIHIEATGRTGRRSYTVDEAFFALHSPIAVRNSMPAYPERERFHEPVPYVGPDAVTALCGDEPPILGELRPLRDWTNGDDATDEPAQRPRVATEAEEGADALEDLALVALDESRGGRAAGDGPSGGLAVEREVASPARLELLRAGEATAAGRTAMPTTTEMAAQRGFTSAVLVTLPGGAAALVGPSAGGTEVHLPLTTPWGDAGVATATGPAIHYEFGRPVVIDDTGARRQLFNDSSQEVRVLILSTSTAAGTVAAPPAPGAATAVRPLARLRSAVGAALTGEAGDARPVLVDPEADRRLRRDGFVKFPLLSPEQAEELRATYFRLRGPDRSGTGFVADFTEPDDDYRRAVSDAIAAAVDARVVPLFAGYRPFIRNFLCKFPGETSDVHLHRDWMYVDERTGARTYAVWIPLEDVTGDNGQLRVLRGSHRLNSMLRGTNLVAPWLDHTETIEERLLSVPARAGECIVFDNALVHSSYPNLTDRPRVVLGLDLHPIDEPLIHFWRGDDGPATRYSIDDEFFLRELPQQLLEEPPSSPALETVEVVPDDLTAAELAARIDGTPHGRIDLVRRRARAVSSAARDVGHRGRAAVTAGVDGVTSARAGAATRWTEASGRARTFVDDLPSRAAMRILAANEALVTRFGPDHGPVWSPSEFEWAAGVDAAYPDVRREVEALLASDREIPHIEDVTGGVPQGNIGPWRSFVLMHQGRWIDWNCERCPATTELVRSIPRLSMAGFSVLEPGTHITEHRGPNKGALRHQLGVIVPGEEGDCRIRVGDEMLFWREGESVMFDFTFPHEAWNDSDGIRVLLMLEVETPLPWYLRPTNRLAQRSMAWFPTTRDITRRLRRLEPTLAKVPA